MSFYGTANGSIVACCESQETTLAEPGADSRFFNNLAYKTLRKDLIAGRKPSLCEKCWKNEKSGLKSNRIQAWEDVEKDIFGMRKLESDTDGTVEQFPSFLELKCSNVCNLKCRMCHPESSHRIIEDREIIDRYRDVRPWSETPLRPTHLFEDLKNLSPQQASGIRVLQYSGGEPLMSREQFELTSRFADLYGHQIHLRYSTNLNNLNFEKYDVIAIWRKFKHVHVKVSADGIDDVYNYIRVGGSFTTLVENIQRLKEAKIPQLQLAVGFTTQSYNVFQLPETVDFYSDLIGEGKITSYLLYFPTFMCISNMPDHLKEKVISKLQKSKWDFSDKISFLKNSPETEGTLDRWKVLMRYTEDMERKYNITEGYAHLLQKYLP